MKLKCVFVLLFVIIFFVGLLAIKTVKKTTPNSNLPISEVKFYDDKSFIEGINKAAENFNPPAYKIAGAVVNHHTLASYIIADVFKKISVQEPKVLIILGPNHYEKGNFNVLTSKYLWNTKYGVVEPDENIIDDLISKNLARLDEEVLLNDHATTGLLPFVKFYMPSVEVVQLLVSKKLTKDEANTLSDTLSAYAKEGAIIIASTDFSHYLTAGQANVKDQETLRVINNFDYNSLFSFGSDHIDSPGSLAVLLMTMQKIGKAKQEIIYHANSATFRPDLNSFTTSYFSMLYH
jgi:AmmeMemoRadiSam system protein B